MIKLPPPPLREDGLQWVDCPVCRAEGTQTHESSKTGRTWTVTCLQCFGHGYVVQGSVNETCIHDRDPGTTVGRCLTRYTCKKCGDSYEIDSSD